MPWRIENTLNNLGANFVKNKAWEPYAVQDGNLITGQQQMSGAKTAELVLSALK